MDDFFRIDSFASMTQIDKDALKKALADAGEKPAPFALKIGRDKDFIADYLNGRKKSFKLEDAQKIADGLGMPLEALGRGANRAGAYREEVSGLEVVGKVSAGVYRDISVEDQDGGKPRISFAKDLRWPHAKQYALEVEGDSMDELFPDGSTVVCVDYADSGLSLKDGMPVHVERYMMDGQLVEATLKEVRRERGGRLMLWPRSTNPTHKPFEVSAGAEGEVKVRGIVIGEWKPYRFSF